MFAGAVLTRLHKSYVHAASLEHGDADLVMQASEVEHVDEATIQMRNTKSGLPANVKAVDIRRR